MISARFLSFRIAKLVLKALAEREIFGMLVVRIMRSAEEISLLEELTVADIPCLVDMQGVSVAL